MADNTELPSGGGGDTIATDDISGVKYQRIKVGYGADGSFSEVTDVSTNPLPVALSATDNSVLDSIQAAVEGTVTVDWAGTAPPIGAGVEATALRVTVATDSTGVLSIDDNGASITVDGTVTANLSATDNAVLDTIAAPVSVLGTATYAETTSSGTIVGAVRNDSLASLVDTDNEIAPLQVNASGALYVAVTGSVTVASHAVTNAGVFAVQIDGDGLTSLQLLDDIVVTFGTSTYTETTSKGALVGAIRNDALASLVDTDNEAAPLQVNSSGALYVAVAGTVTVGSHAVTNAGTFAVQAAQSGTWTVELGTTDNAVLDSIDEAVTAVQAAVEGTLTVGSHAVTNAGTFAVQAQPTPVTSGGCSVFRSIDVDESEADVKTSAGQIYGFTALNLSSSPRYLKFYDGIASGIEVGSDTPLMTFPVPTAGDTNGSGINISFPMGVAFSTGLCVAATTALADADTGAPGANEVVVNVYYK